MDATGVPPDNAGEVGTLLNKLTTRHFHLVSTQIIACTNAAADKDVRKLREAICLIFDRAKDDSTRSDLYVRLCKKMMEHLSPNVRDDTVKNAEGEPIHAAQLFRKYILDHCQEDFERGWVAKEANNAFVVERINDGENVLYPAYYSDDDFTAEKAKRHGLGVIRFIGELFKVQMLTEGIMHGCIKALLRNIENPEEDEIEGLCTLMATAGQVLDTSKGRAHMDVYFSRMKKLKMHPGVNLRFQRMLQDVIDLRARGWDVGNQKSAPMANITAYEQAAEENLAQKMVPLNTSRGGSRRGSHRGDYAQVGPDGWAVSGGAAPRPPPKAGDLSKFGKIEKSAPMTFGLSSVFQKGDKSKSRESIIRQGNMFSMLSGNPEMASEVTGQSRRPPNRESSIDLGPGGVPHGATPPHRRKLQLLPSSVPLENKSESTPSASPVDSEEEPSGTSSLSEAEATVRIEEDSKELFSVRDLQEAELYFTKLPSKHRHLLIDKLVNRAIESKQADAQLVADLFDRAISRNLCSPASFEEGFMPTAEIIDDIMIDAPTALDLFATMIKGAHLHEDVEGLARLASKSMDSDKLVSLLS